jgi:predicted transposase/invertase (TIGR01784 family)
MTLETPTKNKLLEKTDMAKLVRFDWAMKNLLRDKANFDILEGFLAELLHEPTIKINAVLESASNKKSKTDKSNSLDIFAGTDNAQRILIEVQCSGQWDFLKRLLYGTSRAVCEHIKAGSAYKHVMKIISVSIVFFDLGEGEDYVYKGETRFKGIHHGDILGLNEKEQRMYQPVHAKIFQTPTEIFPEYYIIKIPKFHHTEIRDALDEWIYFLKCGEIKENFSAQGLKSASKKLHISNLSEEDQYAYQRDEDRVRLEESLQDSMQIERVILEEKSREKGRAEGIEEGIETIALRLMEEGTLTLTDIAKVTGISEQNLHALKKRHAHTADIQK